MNLASAAAILCLATVQGSLINGGILIVSMFCVVMTTVAFCACHRGCTCALFGHAVCGCRLFCKRDPCACIFPANRQAQIRVFFLFEPCASAPAKLAKRDIVQRIMVVQAPRSRLFMSEDVLVTGKCAMIQCFCVPSIMCYSPPLSSKEKAVQA